MGVYSPLLQLIRDTKGGGGGGSGLSVIMTLTVGKTICESPLTGWGGEQTL